jgi:hypothetical protein
LGFDRVLATEVAFFRADVSARLLSRGDSLVSTGAALAGLDAVLSAAGEGVEGAGAAGGMADWVGEGVLVWGAGPPSPGGSTQGRSVWARAADPIASRPSSELAPSIRLIPPVITISRAKSPKRTRLWPVPVPPHSSLPVDMAQPCQAQNALRKAVRISSKLNIDG